MTTVIPMGTNFPGSVGSSGSSNISEVKGQGPASVVLSSIPAVMYVRRKLHGRTQCQADFQFETNSTALHLLLWLYF